MFKKLIFKFLNYILLERNYSKNTYLSYKNDLEDFNDYLNARLIISNTQRSEDDSNSSEMIKKVDINLISEYFKTLKDKGCNSRTIARKYSSLNSFYKYLLENNYIEKTPFELFEYPKINISLPEYLEYEELEKLLECIEKLIKKEKNKNNSKNNLLNEIRDKALFEFMYSTGVRVSEVCELKIDNINIEESFCIIFGKGKKERIIPFGDKAKKDLQEYIQNIRPILNKKNKSYLFLSRNGDKLSRITIWKNLKKYGKISGLKKNLYPHILRHTFATHLISNGADIRFVQELLGHESILTTQIYTHLDTKTLVEFYKKYSFR
ncbi:MAG: tyrosine recombinase [Spirochaetes bacterium]|nr:tyrosine recombinase [Spirochaetota bacterium]